jgi:hypothetical protein
MSKFLINLLVQISKAFVYSKIQILPPILAHPAQPRAAPARFAPQATMRELSPLGLSSLHVFAKRRLFFKFPQSVNGVSSLSHRYQEGPTHQIHLIPRAGRPESRLHRTSPQLIAPRLPASIIETPIKVPYSPTLIPPLESLLTPSPPAINRVGRKSPAITHRHFHLEQRRPPLKGEHHPQVSPHLCPLLFSSLHT